jgi:hypothetical protein
MLRESKLALLRRVREQYLEIDVSETSALAWVEYVEFERDMDQMLGRSTP